MTAAGGRCRAVKKHNYRYMLAGGLLLIASGTAVLLFLTLPLLREFSAAEPSSGIGKLFMLLPELLLTPLLVILAAGPVICGLVLTVPAVIGLRSEQKIRRAEAQQADNELKGLLTDGALTPEEYDRLTK